MMREARTRVLVIGAGGHAQVVADILSRQRDAGENIDVLGHLDDRIDLVGPNCGSLPVLGPIEARHSIPHDAVVIAIGDNATRRQVYWQLRDSGERFVTAHHPKAVLAPDVRVGDGSVICAGVIVNTGATISENTILNTACSVDHHAHVSSHVHIGPGVRIAGDVHIGEAALVGIGACVLPGKRIGSGSIVAAGAVVICDVPDGMTARGVPAQLWPGTR